VCVDVSSLETRLIFLRARAYSVDVEYAESQILPWPKKSYGCDKPAIIAEQIWDRAKCPVENSKVLLLVESHAVIGELLKPSCRYCQAVHS